MNTIIKKEIYNEVWNQVCDQVYNQVWNQNLDCIRVRRLNEKQVTQIFDQVYRQVRSEIEILIREQMLKNE